MKAMWLAFAAVVGIAIVAAVVLNAIDYSSAHRFSTDNVRVE